jgi:hypothetical protein
MSATALFSTFGFFPSAVAFRINCSVCSTPCKNDSATGSGRSAVRTTSKRLSAAFLIPKRLNGSFRGNQALHAALDIDYFSALSQA